MPDTTTDPIVGDRSAMLFELTRKVVFARHAEDRARSWLATAEAIYDELDRYPANEVPGDRMCELAVMIAQGYATLGASLQVGENPAAP